MRQPVLAIVALVAIGGGACSPVPSPTPTRTPIHFPSEAPTFEMPTPQYGYSPDDGADGGQLVVGDWQEATQFQPLYANRLSDLDVVAATFAGLVLTAYDYKFVPDLATDIPTIQNGGVKVPGDGGDAMTVTWNLKNGLAWSDGHTLTCDDFDFTWSWVVDPQNRGLARGTTGYDQITSVDCPTPTRIVYHYRSIFEGYLSLGPVLPRQYVQQIPMAAQVNGAGWAPADLPNVPTSGAFRFGSVSPGSNLTLIRNPAYHGVYGNQTHLDSLVLKWYPDRTALAVAFAGGELDFAKGMTAGDIGMLQAAGIPDSSISAIPSLTYEVLGLNWADGSQADPVTGVGSCSRNRAVAGRGTGCPVHDPAFRKAMAFAIDKNAINDTLLGGLEAIANTNIAPDAYYFVDEPPVTFDPTEAGQILDAAGWTMGTTGIREKGGLKAVIELCASDDKLSISMIDLIAAQLTAVGIKVVGHPVPADDFLAGFNQATIDTPCALSRSNFDVAAQSRTMSVDPMDIYGTYHSSQVEPNGGNDAQVSDPLLDAALDKMKGTVDFVEVRHAMKTFQDIYADQTIEIPLYFMKSVQVLDVHVGNFFGNPTASGPLWNAVDWYRKP